MRMNFVPDYRKDIFLYPILKKFKNSRSEITIPAPAPLFKPGAIVHSTRAKIKTKQILFHPSIRSILYIGETPFVHYATSKTPIIFLRVERVMTLLLPCLSTNRKRSLRIQLLSTQSFVNPHSLCMMLERCNKRV